jgi:hypothetical protein
VVSLVLALFVAQLLPKKSQINQSPLLSIVYNLALQFVLESDTPSFVYEEPNLYRLFVKLDIFLNFGFVLSAYGNFKLIKFDTAGRQIPKFLFGYNERFMNSQKITRT